MKTAFPSIVRFIICCSFIYLGFTICGWIVFGPYHEKVTLYSNFSLFYHSFGENNFRFSDVTISHNFELNDVIKNALLGEKRQGLLQKDSLVISTFVIKTPKAR